MNKLPSTLISHIFDYNGIYNSHNLQIVNREFNNNLKRQLQMYCAIKFSYLHRFSKEERDKFRYVIYDITDPISKGILPKCIISLHITEHLDKPLEQYILPESIEDLSFQKYNHPISKGILPKNLKSLYFGIDFDQPIGPNILPANLICVHFGHRFNQPIDDPNILPNNLRILEFGKYFNNVINFIPPNLIDLIFGKMFSGPIPEKLPESLIYIQVGKHYRFPLDQFPETIEVAREY
jgi:hypothetical protein